MAPIRKEIERRLTNNLRIARRLAARTLCDLLSAGEKDRIGLNLAHVNLHPQTRTSRDMDHAIDDSPQVDGEMLVHRVPSHQVFLMRLLGRLPGAGIFK